MKLYLMDLLSHPEEELRPDVSFEVRELEDHRVLCSEITEFTVCFREDRKLRVSAEGSVTFRYSCDRCLTETEVPVRFSETWVLDPEKSEDEDHDPVYCFSDHALDTDELITEMIRPNLPVKVLCRPECKGLCPSCGANLNEAACSCGLEPRKTKMAEALEKAMLESKKRKAD
ncbi:MAG: DUF177 domain-containing protein [Lachnospiraceae bacterium]|nr:DUF177 domain-containing protein [Lachnospiraceae bacterium]